MRREERVSLRVKQSTQKKLLRMSKKIDTTMLLLVEQLVNDAYEKMMKGEKNGD